MSKKLKVIMILSVILVAIGLVFGINTIFRYYKLQKILTTVEENLEKENYYVKIKTTNNGASNETETFYKEGIGKLVAENGIYTWTDGEKAYVVDETKKEVQTLNISNNISVLVTNERLASLYPGYYKNFFERLFLAGNIENKIKTVEENGEKYTYIEIKEENYTKSYWISNKWNNLIKAKVEFSNGDIYDYEYEIKFYITKLKDVELPDFSDYTIVENTEEVVEE